MLSTFIVYIHLIKLLQYSDKGLKAIVKRPGKSSSEVKDSLQYMEHFSLNEALDFILSHPYVMPTPIIMDGNNHFIRYNEDEIRQFLPKDYRRHRS
ncbi:ArsC/Spx/MgsR family protein [Lactococcus petauri]|uniref:ArsC/Spx/MgsR family protein n=1 Tax=Lactococcus petauri TaxID=1940789 RepID=UPI0038553118